MLEDGLFHIVEVLNHARTGRSWIMRCDGGNHCLMLL
jgi:hypothetical protein